MFRVSGGPAVDQAGPVPEIASVEKRCWRMAHVVRIGHVLPQAFCLMPGALKQAREIDRRNVMALCGLGYIANGEKNKESAVEFFQQALAADGVALLPTDDGAETPGTVGPKG